MESNTKKRLENVLILDPISCEGPYKLWCICTYPDIFTAIQGVSTHRNDRATLRRVSSFEALQPPDRSLPTDFVRLDQDILSPLAGKRQFYVYETMDFWEQIKTPRMSLKCSGLYLSQFRFTAPHLLASGDGTKKAAISGDVYIHPSAKVHLTAKIGPNVSISANARIGAGVRLVNCIILDDVEIKVPITQIKSICSILMHTSIGRWSRVQASRDHNAKLGLQFSVLMYSFLLPISESMMVEDEVVVINSIVLPNKTLNVSVQRKLCCYIIPLE
ncbi:Mannose-1-phosphate guanylyltransferase [Handroanthus impetiginosus]|uniref:Mannose-1-phosphate guanylyltransferase n=1 Tax=Handroanthus impetiginosus TaxID=429701 RepID=A0A2G9GUV0_9LAMI|nr:Mannose-1-phosphate guanylyltransferase [Handroanthus impetiginosus]